MAQALPVYAVAALLIVASAGPVTKSVRDASLGDFEALDDPRPLDSFPFLSQVRPYLPPVVVEWLIVKQSLNLPDGGDFRVDDDGRIVVVWPDGCEESHSSYTTGSVCDDDPCNDPEPDPARCGDPCLLPEDSPDRPADCDPAVPPLECDPGMTPGRNQTTNEPECIPDPKCDLPEDHPERPDGCPIPEPPPPPPECEAGFTRDVNGDCIRIAPRLLRESHSAAVAVSESLPIDDITTDYENLSLIVRWTGLTTPTFQIRVIDTERPQQHVICWTQDGAGSAEQCTINSPGPLNSESERRYSDAVPGPIPYARYALNVQYEPSQTGGSRLDVYLYGTPLDDDANP